MDCLRNQFVPGLLLNDRYETVSPLNHGSFGMVFMAKDHQTGNQVALKCLTKPSAGLEAGSTIKVDDQSEEFKLHSRLPTHDNIVNLLDSFETDHHSYLVLEYCAMGDLYEAIRQEKGPKETEHVRAFMHQLVNSIEFLHQNGIYHRDIKPENIFLTESGIMKLGDFGLATEDAWSYDIAVGSDRYMAPEQFDPQGNGLDTAKADIWSIGVCLLNVLFSRNPFSEPASTDPLFADFARDRQSLFDVFPNLAQDTFEVLCHCMSVDPEKRSLSAVREALDRVVSFTTDDDALDDFCTDTRDVVTATVDRKPLRTPSVASPNMDLGGAFPWAQALHTSAPIKEEPHANVRDSMSFTEELFPQSEASIPDTHDWTSKADTRSIESYVDSGLGLSLGSSTLGSTGLSMTKSKPVPIAGSMPTLSRAGHALSSIFGKKKQFESKSWSDMFEEDEEEQAEFEREQAVSNKKFGPTALSQADTESDGRSTPRAGLAELRGSSVNARSPSSNEGKDDSISPYTGFLFEDSTSASKYSLPSKRSILTSKIDKWAALGDVRRGGAAPTPPRAVPQSTEPSWRRPFRTTTWKRNMGFGRPQGATTDARPHTQAGRSNNTARETRQTHDIWQKKEWNLSTDWRRSDQHLPMMSKSIGPQLDGTTTGSKTIRGRPSRGHLPRDSYDGFNDQISVRGNRDSAIMSEDEEDLALTGSGDFSAEWVGGWKDLHL